MAETATNPETGERAVLINGKWLGYSASASNESGDKRYLIGGRWVDDSGKSELQKFKEEGRSQLVENLPLAGSIVGGVLGSVVQPGGGTYAGAATLGGLIGTITGASIGTSAKQITEQAQGKNPTTREVLGEQVGNVSNAALWQLIGTPIGMGLDKLVSKVVPVAREGAEEAQRALKSHGGSLSASQYYDSPSLQLAESFARAGAGGKGQFISLDKRNADALQAIKNQILTIVSRDPVNDKVAGKLFKNAIQDGEGAHAIASTALYKDFAKRADSVWVDMTDVRLLGIDLKEKIAKGLSTRTEVGGQIVDQLDKVGRTVPFSDAHELRSSLLSFYRSLKNNPNADDKTIRVVAEAAKKVDTAMDDAAKQLSPDLANDYRTISAFYRGGKRVFNHEIIVDLLRTNPERVGENLFKQGNVTEISMAKAALRRAADYESQVNIGGAFGRSIDKERIFDRLQAGYLNQLLTQKAATNVEGETTAKNLMKHLSEAKTDRQFAVMFTPRERDMIAEFGRTAFLTLQNKPSQFGTLAPILQAGAVGDLLISGARVGTDVALLGAPYALGKFLTNADAVRVAINAMKMSNERLTAPVVAKLAGEMTKAMRETEE